jgi:hypothetical protein
MRSKAALISSSDHAAGADRFNIIVNGSGTETPDGATQVLIDVDHDALSFRKARDDAGSVTGEGYEILWFFPSRKWGR